MAPASRQGDVILAFDGRDIEKPRDLPLLVAETPVGRTAQVRVWRKNADLTLAMTIAAMPDDTQAAPKEDASSDAVQPSSALGLKFVPLTSAMRPGLHIGKNVNGLVVTEVAGDSPLAALGLQQGDVIEAINQQATPTPKDVSEKLSDAKHSKGATQVLILFNRAGVNQYVALSLNDQDKG